MKKKLDFIKNGVKVSTHVSMDRLMAEDMDWFSWEIVSAQIVLQSEN